jgi:hypothetical protein
MMRIRRSLFWLLLLAFVSVPCWWVFHFPFRSELILRVLPDQATVVTRHIAPAERWLELLDSPVVTNVANVLEVDSAHLEEALQDDDLLELLKIIGGRYLVTGFIPAMGHQQQPALVFGAWVGGYSQLLRWGFFDRHLDGVSVIPLARGRRVWQLPCDDIMPGYRLSFVVHEGALIGCFSREPLGVLLVEPRLNRQMPVTALAQPWVGKRQKGTRLDELRAVGSLPEGGEVLLLGSFLDVSPERIDIELEAHTEGGTIRMGSLSLPKTSWGLVDKTQMPALLLGNAVSSLFAMPVAQLSPVIAAYSRDPRPARLLASFYNEIEQRGAAFLFSGGDDYCGRVMGMKIPSVGVAVPLAANADGTAVVRKLVDLFNRDFGLGLISTPDPNDPRISILGSVRSGTWKLIRGDERPALAICDGWLIGMSNVGVLRRILKGRSETPAQWAMRLHSRPALVCGWSDLSSSSELALKALAGYTLASLMSPSGGAVQRYDTNVLKAVIRAIGQLGEFDFAVETHPSTVVLQAQLKLP